jgi:biopolymer transport protein ExbD
MGALESGEPSGAREAKGLHRPIRRAGVRLDMTPMVDIAFLLLVFFMVTTVFRAPQAMEMNMPPSDSKVEVVDTNVMTVRVAADETITYELGTGARTQVEAKKLRQLFRDTKAANPDIVVIAKVHPKARYERMVALFDELELADMQRFSLIEMSDADIEELERTP